MAKRPVSQGDPRNLIERLEADVRDAEFMDRDWVPVERRRLVDLLKLARTAHDLDAIDCEGLPEEAVDGPDGRCAICTVRAALEPLFRSEVPA